MKSLFIILSAVLLNPLLSYAQDDLYCPAAKEFITTKEYLMDHPELGLSQQEIIETAKEVSKGCKGAASRFNRAFTVMTKTESGQRGGLKVARRLAQMTDNYTTAFLEIFKKSYLAEYLDLDYKTAMQMAQSLSVDFKGEPERATEDFLQLVKFCTDDKHLALSKPRCGQIAARVVKNTENFDQKIAEKFVDLFEFITSDKGPTPDLVMALEITEKVVSVGPEAPENFKLAYRYAIQEKGLAYSAKDSLNFAMELGNMAKFTDEQRLPANNPKDDGFKTIDDL